MGPVVSKAQYDRIQRLIQAGIDEGAELVCGGPASPRGSRPATT
jgi:aldehyde dehydrogenase (NAD+)